MRGDYMILYHGTSQENKEKILKDGFKTTYGEYGECVYLAVNKDLAYDYGDEIIEVFVDDEYIVEFDEAEVDTNYGHVGLEEVAFKNDYKAVQINYSKIKSDKDYAEVCVYNTSIIEILE
jgi:hypothetical protein